MYIQRDKAIASSVDAFNQAGMIAGTLLPNPRVYSYAYLWTKSEGITHLGTLEGNACYPKAISSTGMVVGYSETKAGKEHGFLWTKDNGMFDLGTLGGDASHANAINDSGQIVGTIEVDPPWLIQKWNWICQKLELSDQYHPDLGKYRRVEVVLWTIPLPERSSE